MAKKLSLPTGRHTGVLLVNLASDGSVLYKFILAVQENGRPDAILAVTSEVSTLDLYEGRIEYLLCCFEDGMHSNLGPNDLCGDIGGFERVAVKMAVETLQKRQRVREGRRNAGKLIRFLFDQPASNCKSQSRERLELTCGRKRLEQAKDGEDT